MQIAHDVVTIGERGARPEVLEAALSMPAAGSGAMPRMLVSSAAKKQNGEGSRPRRSVADGIPERGAISFT